VLTLCLSCNRGAAAEQAVLAPLERPDPSSVSIPKVEETGSDDYFYFYKSGISYENAFADLDECRIYSLSARVISTPPRFVLLGTDVEKPKSLTQSGWSVPYGLIGDLIAEEFIAGAERDSANAANRRCMAYKGYSRYGTSGSSWDQITIGTDTDKLARLALLASGAQPSSAPLGR
jgi:hypothetical protein